MRLVAAGVLPVMLEAVFLTHQHSDHICDLNDVITTHWIMSGQPGTLQVGGPVGTRQVVDGALAMLAPDVSYRLAHHAGPDLGARRQRPRARTGNRSRHGRRAHHRRPATDHRPVEPTLAYRFDHDGRSVVLAGDTVPCPGLDELLVGADVYVQTVFRDDLVRLVTMQRFVDTIDYHSTVEQAAMTAARAGVGTLVLTHQVPTPPPGAADEWIALAKAHFDGNVVFGEDLIEV